MKTLQDFEDKLNEFISMPKSELPPIKPHIENRGRSYDISVSNDSIYFKRKNTKMSVKIEKLLTSFELLLKQRQLLCNDPKFIAIINKECARTFFFQLIKEFDLAEIDYSRKKYNAYMAILKD